MSKSSEKRLLLVLFGLSAITVLSWWIGSKHAEPDYRMNTAVTLGVLGIAAFKVRLIMREFMEVRHAPSLLRRLTDAWITLLFVALFGFYLAGIGIHV